MRHVLCAATLLLALGGVANAEALIPTAAPAAERPVSPHALALRARWVAVPGWELAPYLTEHTQLYGGWSLGLEYLYRMSGFDVVISVEYSWLNGDDGNYLGTGKNPATDTHFLHFENLSSLSVDVSLIGHWNVTRWLEIRLGGGLGIGGVFGNIYQVTNGSTGCTNFAGDPTKCYPNGNGFPPGDVSADTLLKHGCNSDFTNDGSDTPGHPCTRKTDTYPFNVRVIPVLNALIGLRFKAHRNVYVHLETGWRLAGFFLGAGPEFRF